MNSTIAFIGLKRMTRVAFLIIFLLSTFVVPNTNAHAAAAGFSEYYIPGSTDQLFQILKDIDNDPDLGNALGGGGTCTAAPCNRMHNVITVSVSTDNVTVYYDHWENGYGTGSTGNDEVYVVNKGDVLTFESSNIPVPRNAADTCVSTNNNGASTSCYDGRDRIYVAGGAVSVAQSFWPEVTQTVFANAWEVYPIKPYQTSYTIPAGEDLSSAPLNYTDFTQVFVIVQATQSNTSVVIDNPATVGNDVNVTLGRGEITQLFHINAGTTVLASAPVQVQFIVGQPHPGTSSDSRSYTAVPSDLWEASYYGPVPSFGGGSNTDVFVYNPTTSPLTILYEDNLGSGTFVVPANSTRSYQALTGRYVPTNSALYLAANDGTTNFWAIGSVNTENANYNYGFTFIPPSNLTLEYFISWAPGTTDLSDNGSPIFVTPVSDNTTIFVDYSPTDGVVDATYVLDRIQVQRIFDPDNNNTGIHIWATSPIAIVWGEDASAASSGNPYIDAGYTILPLNQDWLELVLNLDKSVDPNIIVTAAGQIATYTLVTTTDQYGLQDVSVVDSLPEEWGYVPGNTVITLPNGTTITGVAADPDVLGQQLTWDAFPVDPFDMNGNETLTIVFQAETISVPTQDFYTNEATSTGTNGTETFSATDTAIVEVVPPGTITGTVWADTNNDAIGDTPIAGVTLELLDSSGNVIATTTTLADGTYSFTNIPPGDYQVRETQPAGYNSVSDIDGGNPDLIGDVTPITVVSGETNSGNDFVEEQPGAITGTVWADTNNDDIGDTPIAGVTLELLDELGNVVATTVTLADGTYSFANIPPGTYSVRETQPAGYDSVSDIDGGNPDLIGDVTPIIVMAGETNSGNDFVEEQPGTITGTVWEDTNNDDIGDTPIGGVTIELLDEIGNVIVTTVTQADGTYSFTNIPPGNYQVRETQPAGYTSVSDADGGNPDLIGDVTLIAVNAGQTSSGNDFIEEQLGSISGQVRYDSDNDGNPADSDNPIAGVTIELYDGSGNLIASTVTDSLGNYTFAELPPGNYTVVEVNPPGFTSTYDLDGPGNTLDIISVALSPGQNSTGNDYLDTSAPSINVEKNPPVQTVPSGTNVIFDITVTNDGNVDLDPVVLTDVQCDVLTQTDNSDGDTTLAVGEAWTYSCTVNNVTVDFTNTVDVTGTPPIGPDVTDSDTAVVDVLPTISVTKDASVVSVPESGGSVTFTYTVTNTGTVNVVITNLSDDQFGTLTGDADCQVGTPLPPGASCSFDYTTNLSGSAAVPHVNVFTANAEDSNGNPVSDTDNAIVEFTPVPRGLAKAITDTDSTYTDGSEVTIGEIVTYEVSVAIPQGSFENARLVDTMDRGLAFVGCDVIDATGLTTNVAGGFDQVCASPTTDDAGGGTPMDMDRRVTFNFGTLTNDSQADVTLTVTYRAIVLDSAANVSGVTLNNTANWSWLGGSIGPVQTQVTLLEPKLQIDKTSNVGSVVNGAQVTFTLAISHTNESMTDAHDVVVVDVLPTGLDYVDNSLDCTVGAQDPDVMCEYDVSTRTILAEWSVITLNGGNGMVRFTVIGNSSLPASNIVTNIGVAEWSSMPGDRTSPSSFSDPANQFATERYYDPPDGINLYGDSDSLTLAPSNEGGGNATPTPKSGFLIPVTGFAPGVVSDLSKAPYARYTDTAIMLEIPSLSVNIPIVGVPKKDGTWNVSWLGNEAGWLEGSAFPSWNGNSVLTSHVYMSNGKPGPFVNLKRLKFGDQIIVHAFGQMYIFEVRTNTIVAPNDASVMKHEEKPWLTLITCKDYDEKTNSYLSRIVARAVLVKVEFDK